MSGRTRCTLLLCGLAAVAGAATGTGTVAAAANANAVAAPAVGAVAPAADRGPLSELQQLMGLLAQRRHAQAHFRQLQYLADLTRPLQSSGTMSYDAPDHLEQRIDTPRRQRLVLDHDELSVQLGRHRRSISLADEPQLAPLLESIRAMLAGDLPALQRRFQLQLSGPLTRWELSLRPRGPALAAQVRDIRMRGQGIQILEVQIWQLDGDRSVMSIEPTP